MPLKIATPVFITLNAAGEVERRMSNEEFSLFEEPKTVQQNTLVTPWAGREMIKALFRTIWDDPTKQNEPIAVDFDRQSLALTLSQNGCEGLRFFFCEFGGRKTLVAFGIKSDGKLIGEPMFRLGFDPTSEDPVVGFEQGHGITLGEFKDTIGDDNRDFDNISEQFLLFPLS
jgi:hypothetical protein